jgi:hypothetical protein
MKTTLFDLYRSPLNVWVEDPLSHTIFTELWADPQINVLVAQGKPGVGHLVLGSPEPERRQVYGIVDRDFDEGNERDWPRAECRILRTPTHEAENLLLDFDVLAALSKGEPADQIRERARKRANDLLFWMVCKAVLRDMQVDLGSGFPGDPSASKLHRLEDVEAHLSGADYWARHGAHWTRWTDPAQRKADAGTWHELLRGELEGEGWRESFSGKEIFRYLRSSTRGLDDAPNRRPSTNADRDLDLAKRIARKMREMKRIPPAITRLRDALRTKARLP